MKNLVDLSNNEIYHVGVGNAWCGLSLRGFGYGLSACGAYIVAYAGTFPEIETMGQDGQSIKFSDGSLMKRPPPNIFLLHLLVLW